MTPGKDNGFIKQAGILAIAGIICRMIGILYRSPLTGIIGDEGNGYYTSAYNIYTIILLVSSYSIPSAISREISIKLAVQEYKNAHRIFHCAIIYVIVIGGIASIFTFFGAGLLVGANSVRVLKIFAPTIFLSGLLGVLRGYFQAHNSMLQTSVSQIIEQLFNAVISIAAAYILMNSLSYSGTTSRAVSGASGSAVGTGSGVLAALIFMWLVYLHHVKALRQHELEDKSSRLMSYGRIFRNIFRNVTPMLFSTFIYNFSTSLNQTIYTGICSGLKGRREEEIATSYGIFAGKAVIIANIPIAISSAMSAAIIPSISATYIHSNLAETNKKVDTAIHATMLIAIPAAVGLGVLSLPVVQLLFPQRVSMNQASDLLRCLSVSVIFYSLSTLTNAVLQAIGKPVLPVLHAFGSLLVQTALLVILMLNTTLNLYSLCIAAIVYSFLMCILNGIAVRKHLGYRYRLKRNLFIPLAASAVMGICAGAIYRLLYSACNSNAISLLLTVCLASILYFIMIIRLGGLNQEELSAFPYGNKIIRLAKAIKILR